MSNKESFLQAIRNKNLVKIRFHSKEKGMIERECVPFDFGPWRRNIVPNPERYHCYDLNSPEGKHNLSILPEQIIDLEVLAQSFDPSDYINWSPPYNWFVERDWGNYS